MLVVPFSHDQPDNAQRVERMGIGKRIPRAKFAWRLREEDGVAAACDSLEAVLGLEKATIAHRHS